MVYIACFCLLHNPIKCVLRFCISFNSTFANNHQCLHHPVRGDIQHSRAYPNFLHVYKHTHRRQHSTLIYHEHTHLLVHIHTHTQLTHISVGFAKNVECAECEFDMNSGLMTFGRHSAQLGLCWVFVHVKSFLFLLPCLMPWCLLKLFLLHLTASNQHSGGLMRAANLIPTEEEEEANCVARVEPKHSSIWMWMRLVFVDGEIRLSMVSRTDDDSAFVCLRLARRPAAVCSTIWFVNTIDVRHLGV